MARRIVITGRGKGQSQAMKELAERIQALPPKMDHAVVRGLQSATQRGIGEVVHSIDTTKPHAPNDSGTLRSSVRAISVKMGGILRVEAPHAAPMEFGTRPFTPPLLPLAQWAVRKGLAATEDEAKGIAYAIRDKFAEDGIEPRHYFRRAMKVIRERVIPAEVQRELGEII